MLPGESDDAGRSTRIADASGTVCGATEQHPDGLQTSGSEYSITEVQHEHQIKTAATGSVQLHRDLVQDTAFEKRRLRCHQEAWGPRNGHRAMRGSVGYDQRHKAIWGGSSRFEDAVSQYSYYGSQFSAGHYPSPGR